MRKLIAVAVLCWIAGCTKESATKNMPFESAQKRGLMESKLFEASGLVESVANPGLLWTVNDSGNPSEVYLIDTAAHIKMVCQLPVPNRDWEEIAIGNGPVTGKTYVYVGDIGDNQAKYDDKIFYRFEEPVADADSKQIVPDTIIVQLPDGKRDSEAFTIDPISQDLIIVSKREDSVRVYNVKSPLRSGVVTAGKMATLPYHNIVAMDISPDGSEVLMKDYNHVYYWKRGQGEPIYTTLTRKPIELPYEPEKQGESIAFARDGSGYYTVSESEEGGPSNILFYKRH